MDIKLFQQKLNEICTIAEENGKQLSQQQIREHFDESDLNTSQLVKILQYLKLKGITIEGADEGFWALLDFGDFVVHCFQPEGRDYYRLEEVWNDAPTIDFEPDEPKSEDAE